MSANNGSNPAKHFGRQMKKERLTHGWTLREFSARTGIDFTTASRIENGKRPPTETVAKACDAVWPGRRGWFLDYYEEMSTWSEVPAAFKDWTEREDKAASLHDWWPSVVSGFLQTGDYAVALLRTYPAVTEEAVKSRLANRMERQRRLFAREVRAWFIVDEMALYRLVGSAEIIAAQMRHLSAVAAMPNVTLQVLPALAHPANASGFIIADESAYAEHVAGGFVYTGETVSALARIFDSLRGECYRVSESAALIERMSGTWTTGGSPLGRMLTAEPA